MRPVSFRDDRPESLTNAMRDYQAMLDAIRDGFVKREKGEVPDDPQDRSQPLQVLRLLLRRLDGRRLAEIRPEMWLEESRSATRTSTRWPSS